MRYQCRCNKRACQARRTLAKHPDEYVRPPKCHRCKDGLMYVDKTRQRRADSDRGRPCNCDGIHHTHRYGQKGRNHRETFLFERSLREASRHNPYQHIPADDEPPF